jgi:hypothetical protein
VRPPPSSEPGAAAGGAVGHRRASSLRQPDPNSGHGPTLGEPLDLSHLSPGRERRRPRRISADRVAPTAKGGIASPQVFVGCFP